MKLNHLLLGGLMAGALVSCSDDFAGDEGKILENETTTYVRLSLNNAGGTRAGDYENGTSDESAVKSILLTFYDAGRNYVGRTTITVGDDAEVVPGTPDTGSANVGTIESILTLVAPVNLPENINYPKYVIAYVNPTSAAGDLLTDKLEDAGTVIRSRSSVSHTGNRTMNNSVYFDSETGYIRYATEVDFQKSFFPTMEEAKAAGDATINITVERMEAKVRLTNRLDELEPEDYESGSGLDTDKKYTLEFVPEAWFVNGTERRSFLLKNYRSTRNNVLMGNFPDASDYGMKLPEVQNAFRQNTSDSRYSEVNDAVNLRSYWAIDPTYFTDDANDIYPDVSYDVSYNGFNTNGKEYPLQYRSYDVVTREWNAHNSTNYIKFAGTNKTHEYVLENTMSYATLGSTDAMASMTSVVLLGHYVVKNATGAIVFDGSTTDRTQSFYVRHDADNNRYVMVSDNEAIDFFLERAGSTLFVQTIDRNGNPVPGAYEPLRAAHLRDNRYGVNYSDFELVYPSTTVTGGKKLSEQWRTMSIKSTAGVYNNKIFIYDASIDSGNGGYRNINDADIPSLRTRLYSTFGVLEKFQTGKAYFNVPLKHIWGAGNKDNKFDPKNIALGDYGVVRNHVYDLTINKITGLGTGIGDINQPIVPPTDDENYYISTRLNILQWRLVSQSVDL